MIFGSFSSFWVLFLMSKAKEMRKWRRNPTNWTTFSVFFQEVFHGFTDEDLRIAQAKAPKLIINDKVRKRGNWGCSQSSNNIKLVSPDVYRSVLCISNLQSKCITFLAVLCTKSETFLHFFDCGIRRVAGHKLLYMSYFQALARADFLLERIVQ